jgi:hypothetical protein
MTKSNFGKLSEEAMFAHPPLSAELNIPGLGAIRGRDGRSARRTGRTEQFATVVSREFKAWMKAQAKKAGKSQAALLDDMQAAYIEKHGE